MIRTLEGYASEVRATLACPDSIDDDGLARVVELRGLCMELVLRIDAATDDIELHAHLVDLARELLAQTDRLSLVAATRRDELTSELRGLANSRRAAAGYHSGNELRGERGSHVL